MKVSLFGVFLVLCFIPCVTLSQNTISGKVKDAENRPVPYCLLGILSAADSAVVRGNISNEAGEFTFTGISPGDYFIKVSTGGYSDAYSAVFNVDSASQLQLEPVMLKNPGKDLEEVAVTVLKKPLEFKNGNITVNIEGSPLATGNSVYDLLMRLPGVIVDGDNISLQGKSGVRFLFDDRLQQLSGPQLTSLLKSIHASTVEKIEIITNPPAKYDASGGAGLINIVTKKIRITGFSGNVMNSTSQGFYTNSFTQVALNYKAKKISVFSHFNAGYADFRAVNDWTRIVPEGTLETTLSQHYVEKTANRFASCFLGGDWYPDKKNTLSVRVDLKPGTEVITRKNETSVSDSSLGYRNLLFNFEKPNSWFWQDYNFNYEHLFDTAGTKLSFNTAYSIYPDSYKGQFENNYLDGAFHPVQPARLFRSKNRVDVQVLASKLDFEKNLSKTLRLESGAKASWQSLYSDFVFENYNESYGMYVSDPAFTNTFLYQENIVAAYVDLKKEIKKINLQVGLRAENTDVKAESKTSNFTYSRSYLNLFPTASVSYNRSDKHNFQLSYNRRINRADYNKFNPYPSFRSILTNEQGNPHLLPMYTHNIQFVYGFKGKIINTFAYTQTANYFLTYNKQNNITKELVFYTGNLKRSNTFSYSLFIQQDLKRWWNATLYGSLYYNMFAGDIDGVYYSSEGLASYMGLVNQLSLSKNTKLEISGWVVGPWLDGVVHFLPRGGLNMGIKQNFLSEKLTISAGMYDITYSNRSKGYIDYADQYSENVHRWDSRRVYLNVSYNFGKIKVEQKNISEEEEKQRLKK